MALEPLRYRARLRGAGAALLALEAAAVGGPLTAFVTLRPGTRGALWAALAGALAVGAALWAITLRLLLRPIDRAVALRRAGQPVDGEATYRALRRAPLAALAARAALIVVGGLVVGAALVGRGAVGWLDAATIVSVCALHGTVAQAYRALWYGRVLRPVREALLPGIPPLRLFRDRFRADVAHVAVAVGAPGIAAIAAFIYFFIPIQHAQYVGLQTWFPLTILALTLAWQARFGRSPRAIGDYLAAATAAGADGAPARPVPFDDPRALRAFRAAQSLPYVLGGTKVAFWAVAALLLAVEARLLFDVEREAAVLMAGAVVLISVAAALYEALLQRRALRPLLLHLQLRHRLALRDVRSPFSLRAKMLVAFGGLLFFACGLSLFWGFVQYRSLANGFIEKQASLRLDALRAQLAARAARAGHPADPPAVREALVQLAGADQAVYYYAAPGGGPLLALGGGGEGAPPLPEEADARLRERPRGKLDLPALRLLGRFDALEPASPDALGKLAVLYPSYRGRGPGGGRPLFGLLAFFVGLFALSAGIVVLAIGDLTGPIRTLEQRADEMARGEIARPVPSGGEADEVGSLTFALEEMRRALRDRLRSTEELNVDLEREVQRRTADLARSNAELRDALEKLTRAQAELVRAEKLASIGQLVAGIAHEINNPVNAVVNSVEPLEGALAEIVAAARAGRLERLDAAGGEVGEMVRVIRRGAHRTKDIVRALHNYSRADEERLADVDLRQALDESLELLRHHLKGGIEVERAYDGEARVRGHAGQLQQVFMNLLTNAAQAIAARPGGAGRLRIATRRDGGELIVEIADDGPGIPPEVLPRIFDPFFTTKEVGEGSGLGLSIVHGIVERHGGRIQVESEPGRGTTFRIALPIEPVAARGEGATV